MQKESFSPLATISSIAIFTFIGIKLGISFDIFAKTSPGYSF
jgi:hypothetical protein